MLFYTPQLSRAILHKYIQKWAPHKTQHYPKAFAGQLKEKETRPATDGSNRNEWKDINSGYNSTKVLNIEKG